MLGRTFYKDWFSLDQKPSATATFPVAVSTLVDARTKKPSVITELEEDTVIEGDFVQLKAEFSGHPPLEFSWFKDEIGNEIGYNRIYLF